MNLNKINDEVYYGHGVGEEELTFISAAARNNARQRCRICTHESPDSHLHEMFIALGKSSYIRPHLHKHSDESLAVIEGEGLLTSYSDAGEITGEIYLSADDKRGCNYFRIKQNTYHGLYVFSDILVFKETILGPFDMRHTEFAQWSPAENELPAVERWSASLRDSFLKIRGHCGAG